MSIHADSASLALIFRGERTVSLEPWTTDEKPLAPDEVSGHTLASLVSPGTEINGLFDVPAREATRAGYAAVFEIDHVGSAVKCLRAGDRVFALGEHAATQRHPADKVIRIGDCVTPAHALFTRIMGVNWTTLRTTAARPADMVLVMGLGIVGHLAAQMFHAAGYRVIGVDPNQARRTLAEKNGIRQTFAAAPLNDPALADQVALAMDCSGHEQAIIDACQMVRKGGEVALIGVPWKQRCNAHAFAITHAVFHRYLHLHSGWEWELPMHRTDFCRGSIMENLRSAMEWITQGRVRLEGLYETARPAEAQSVYEALSQQKTSALSTIFDWT